ncbi:MAG: hypothetical protein GTN62_15015 [Gemmatimonadales bacterium]|nr:hypothetical protein [Gemmatimonadales bacterium]NIN13397.1 hypothetical protein [Gemmatimonadales bacterium]NIN51400.1 hypothetical protein [Gemmatimonadales bacterium]NIP08864.1 hypothetical protein [Gemmatimonadales bacterium]NIQ99858.1 hypothetical protein [Gemmatimonadales bacterium]
MRHPKVLAAALALLSAAPAYGTQQLPDSLRILAPLRDAQARFERIRRWNLPWTPQFGGGEGEQIIGRFRYWPEYDARWTPRPEHDRVIRERNKLLALLDSAATILPDNGWITGQQVRYLIDGGRLEDALRRASECRAQGWWCQALTGLVAHLRGDFTAADSAFAAALPTMTEADRCRWTDLSLVVDRDLVRSYRAAGCGNRDSLNRRIWWLADPLYLVPGNERRTEHYARLVMSHLFEDTANPYGVPWRDDSHEMVIRYGWSVRWERESRSPGASATQPTIIGHQRRGGRHFLPSASFLAEPSTMGWNDWELDPVKPREIASPPYSTRFVQLEPQVLVFRRGDSAVVAGVFHFGEREEGEKNAEVALIVVPDEHAAPTMVQETVTDGIARLEARVARRPALVSLEALDSADSLAARKRYWLDVDSAAGTGFALSDLLLIEGFEPLPRQLGRALRLARPSAHYKPGEPIQLYWEIYRVSADEPPFVSLTVVKQGKSVFRKVAEFLGFASRERPKITLEWREAQPTTRASIGRSVTLQLPDDQAGRYAIRLKATTPGGETAETEKEIFVEKR